MYLYAKDLYKAKHQFLIKKGEDVGTKHFNNSRAFNKYSNNMDDIYSRKLIYLKIFIKTLKNTIQIRNVKY